MSTTGECQIDVNFSVKDGDPAQWQPQFVRAAQRQVVEHLEILQVKIRLVEAVKEHQTASTSLSTTPGEIWQGRYERAELDRDGHAHSRMDIRDQFEVGILQFHCIHIGV